MSGDDWDGVPDGWTDPMSTGNPNRVPKPPPEKPKDPPPDPKPKR